VSPVKYELGFYIPEDGILHSHRRENLKSYKYILPLRYVITSDAITSAQFLALIKAFEPIKFQNK
jgi:hypothetical protein